jgi:hypothetical protein
MKMHVTGVSAVIAELNEALLKTKVEAKKKITKELLEDLKAATPVDTGRARDGWVEDKNGIKNDVPYIEELNEGSSQQAPTHFIERTILSNPNVKANGQICIFSPSS